MTINKNLTTESFIEILKDINELFSEIKSIHIINSHHLKTRIEFIQKIIDKASDNIGNRNE